MEEKKRILIIDDEADLSQFLKWNLEKAGYEVFSALNGEAGLKLVDECKPDLLLLDINMPKMNGITVYERLTNSFGKTRVPVIVFTTRQELKETFYDIDADGFVAKPFETNVLLKEIDRVFSRQSGRELFLVDVKENPHLQDIYTALTQERFKVSVIDSMAVLKSLLFDNVPLFIVMEYMQRDLGGEEFIRELKRIPALRGVPLIVYSYSGFQELKDKALKAGADEYLGKPENPSVIISAIRKFELGLKE